RRRGGRGQLSRGAPALGRGPPECSVPLRLMPFLPGRRHNGRPVHHQRAETPMPYTLPDLPYAYDALEPHIDAQTMEIHHSKHHNTYVANLNAAVEGTEYDGAAIEELVEKVETLPDRIR